MQLHKVRNGSRIRIVADAKSPPGAPPFDVGQELEFRHIDGMYSYCKDDSGNVVHLAAWTDVDVVREGYKPIMDQS